MKINGSIITNFSHSRASRVQVNSVKMPFYGNLVGACDNCTQIEEIATRYFVNTCQNSDLMNSKEVIVNSSLYEKSSMICRHS